MDNAERKPAPEYSTGNPRLDAALESLRAAIEAQTPAEMAEAELRWLRIVRARDAAEMRRRAAERKRRR